MGNILSFTIVRFQFFYVEEVKGFDGK